ncbi:hypothetical protein CCP3SC15_2660003 [Gammaproteobacteria bacterium]
MALLPLFMVAFKWIGTSHQSVPYLAGAIVTGGMAIVNFLGHKHYTFAQPVADNPITPTLQSGNKKT